MNQIAKKSLIDKYGQDTRLKEIDGILETQQPAYLRATSVFGAQECFIVRGLYERKKRPFLIDIHSKNEITNKPMINYQINNKGTQAYVRIIAKIAP